MSDTNRTTLLYKEESSYPSSLTFPAGSPTLATFRHTGESLGQDTETTESGEIRSDRQRAYVARTGLSASGDINFELRTDQDIRDGLEAVLLSAAWTSSDTETTTDFSMVNSDNSLNRTTGDFTTKFSAGDWLYISGFTDSANNGWFRAASVVALKIVLEGSTVNDEAAGDSVTVEIPAYVENGTTFRSFAFERQYGDLTTPEYAQLVGYVFETLALSVGAKAMVTGSFGFMGKGEVQPTPTSTGGDGSPTAAGTGEPMNTVDNVKAIIEGTNTPLDITDLSLNLNNNLRAREVVGTLGPKSVGTGEVALNGSVTILYDDATQYDKYLAFTTTRLALRFEDNAGNVLLFDVPEVKLSNGRRVAGGKNQDVVAALDFEAFRDSTLDRTLRVYYRPAA